MRECYLRGRGKEMKIEELKEKMDVGLEFKKVRATSKVLSITPGGIKYSLGVNGNSKTVSFQEMNAAIYEIENNGYISREWFKKQFPVQSQSSPCNYSAIGGLFMHFSYVKYDQGKYVKQ